MKPTLIYLYGSPASGKLSVAEKLAELTGFTLFHNHVTVNAIGSVFPFGSEAYEAVLYRLRLDVFGTAAKTGTSLIFTNNSAWPGPNGRARFQAFSTDAEHAVETHGGRTVFIRLSAPSTSWGSDFRANRVVPIGSSLISGNSASSCSLMTSRRFMATTYALIRQLRAPMMLHAPFSRH
jgi:hypothetical protein